MRVLPVILMTLFSLLYIACSGGSLKQPEDWNKTERGALIGGAGGAALGAAVGSQSGNTGTGALIGGAAGAGAGGLIGDQLDEAEKDDDDDYPRRY